MANRILGMVKNCLKNKKREGEPRERLPEEEPMQIDWSKDGAMEGMKDE